jgi:hypothetical protein
VSRVLQLTALGKGEVGGNEQYGRSTTKARLKELVLVDDEVLIEYRYFYTCAAGGADKLVASAKVFLIGETFMKTPDPGQALGDFIANVKMKK